MDNGDAVAEFFRYFQHMGGKEDGPACIAEGPHGLLELVGG